jgi:hypothetical protein
MLIGDMLTTFRTLKLEREGIAALLVLKETLDLQRVPFYLIEKLQTFFRRLPHEPGLRFDQLFT